MYGYHHLQNDLVDLQYGHGGFCTLCLVKRLENGKKCHMKTITNYGIGNQLPIMLGKLPLASPLN
jgi:hypothetical protein